MRSVTITASFCYLVPADLSPRDAELIALRNYHADVEPHAHLEVTADCEEI